VAPLLIMAKRSHGDSNLELVNNLRKNGVIKNDAVYEAMKSTDRKLYVSDAPYDDCPQRIGYNATISAPHMHAWALEVLHDNLIKGDNVTALDVGSGSGYLTACFARMIGEQGRAFGIDHIPELVNKSVGNIKHDDPSLLESGRVVMRQGDGRLGYDPNKENNIYDAIHVGAAAPQVPSALLEQLKPGGCLVMPVGPHGSTQAFQLWQKDLHGNITKRDLLNVKYMALRDKNDQWPS